MVHGERGDRLRAGAYEGCWRRLLLPQRHHFPGRDHRPGRTGVQHLRDRGSQLHPGLPLVPGLRGLRRAKRHLYRQRLHRLRCPRHPQPVCRHPGQRPAGGGAGAHQHGGRRHDPRRACGGRRLRRHLSTLPGGRAHRQRRQGHLQPPDHHRPLLRGRPGHPHGQAGAAAVHYSNLRWAGNPSVPPHLICQQKHPHRW